MNSSVSSLPSIYDRELDEPEEPVKESCTARSKKWYQRNRQRIRQIFSAERVEPSPAVSARDVRPVRKRLMPSEISSSSSDAVFMLNSLDEQVGLLLELVSCHVENGSKRYGEDTSDIANLLTHSLINQRRIFSDLVRHVQRKVDRQTALHAFVLKKNLEIEKSFISKKRSFEPDLKIPAFSRSPIRPRSPCFGEKLTFGREENSSKDFELIHKQMDHMQAEVASLREIVSKQPDSFSSGEKFAESPRYGENVFLQEKTWNFQPTAFHTHPPANTPQVPQSLSPHKKSDDLKDLMMARAKLQRQLDALIE